MVVLQEIIHLVQWSSSVCFFIWDIGKDFTNLKLFIPSIIAVIDQFWVESFTFDDSGYRCFIEFLA